jgi:protein tyrosine phosphatase (PTP) superfamily phosphohydrolase (DUF442 family)
MKIFPIKIKTLVLTIALVSNIPGTIVSESDRSSAIAARIFLKSMAETVKKTSKKIPFGSLFILQSRIAHSIIDQNISLENQSSIEKAFETLIPVAVSNIAQTCHKNALDENKTSIINKTLARDLILKSVLSTFFVGKETSHYKALSALRRVSSFFDTDIFIDPTNYKKHFNMVQGISIFVGEQIAVQLITPLLKRSFSLENDLAKLIATFIVEDICYQQISDVVKTTSNILFNFSANIGIADNFRAVQEGKLYRCRQPSKQEFEKYIKEYGIKTVLNLRGDNPDKQWYKDEVEILKKLNVKLVSVPLTVSKLPTSDQVKVILDTFNEPGPILTHCRVGADRTGLVSALWMLEKMGSSLDNALKQQTIHFGHFGYIWYRWPSMRKFTTIWNNLKNQYRDNTSMILAHYSKLDITS